MAPLSDLPADFPRPSRHPFDPDPLTHGATCLTCGNNLTFGGLHDRETFSVAVPDDAPIPICPACTHYAHDKGPCRVVVGHWGPSRTCGCKPVAA